MSHFQLFHPLVHRSHFDPQTISFFQIRQPKKYFKHSCKQNIIIPASLCSKVFLLLCQGDQLNVAWCTEQGFFCHFTGLQPSLSRKLPQTQLANCFESRLVEFPFLFAQPILELFQLLYSGLYVLQQVLKPQFLISEWVFTVSTVTFFCFFNNWWYNNIFVCAEWKIIQSRFSWFTKTSSSFTSFSITLFVKDSGF